MNHRNRHRFIALIRGLTQEMGGQWHTDFADFNELIDQETIMVEFTSGDAQFTFGHSVDAETSGQFLLQSKLGKSTQEAEEDMHMRLLQLNFEICPFEAIGYGFDGRSGAFVHSRRVDIAGSDPNSVYLLMSSLAEHTRHWRDGVLSGVHADAEHRDAEQGGNDGIR